MERRPIPLLVILTMVFALFASACTSEGDDDTTEGASPTETPSSEEPTSETDEMTGTEGESGTGEAPADLDLGPGVTEDTITVGYAYLDFDSLVEQGFAPNGWGDQEAAMQSVVDGINASGGINGRTLEVIYEGYSPLGTEDAEAVCLRLTEDNEVFAVLGGFLGPAEPANTCIVGRQGTILVGGVQSEERLGEATAPWITDRPLRTRQAATLLDLLQAEGKLDSANVAVVTNIDAEDTRDAVLATLGDYGVEPVEDLLSDAAIGDVVAEDQTWATLAERIRGSGADTVLVSGNPSSSIRNIASQGLDVEIWVLDQESLLSLGSTVDLESARGALAAAPMAGDERWDHETVAPCREAFEAANPGVEVTNPEALVEGDEDVQQGLTTACRFLKLFETVAAAAGDELNNDTFAEAAAGLSEFSIPGQPFASLGADKFDSNDSFRLVSFDPSIGQDGGFEPLTDIADVTP